MLSKRNFIMMLTMIFVILALFLFSIILKDFFNDYDVNHMAGAQAVEKNADISIDSEAAGQVIFFGDEDNGYFNVIKEWTEYRKRTFEAFPTLEDADEIIASSDTSITYLLVDGELLSYDTEMYTQILTDYVMDGGVVIFYRMPTYDTIAACDTLKDLLGIQRLRARSVDLKEIRIFSGFLLGGETHYLFDDNSDAEICDMERSVPWYDVSARTKTYMVGFVSDADRVSLNVKNEDMPAIIWRSNMKSGSVFALNGDYMKSAGVGILDAMLYESREYYLYSVVNAQNLFITGFPDLCDNNEEQMMNVYASTTELFSSDVLWPSFVAAASKNDWKISSFISVKQSDSDKEEPRMDRLIDYLVYFNEESAEAGVSLGRADTSDIRRSVMDENSQLESLNLNYMFAGGFVQNRNKDKLENLINENGQMDYFTDIRTVVGEYLDGERVLYWLTDKITFQNATTDAYKHSYRDSLLLKSIETALGYSGIQLDIQRVLNPKGEKDEWQNLADVMSANIDTYWKPFSVFDKTTVSQSDTRVRNFLNGSVKSYRDGDSIIVETDGFTDEAYLLLRTHGELISSMTGGKWEEVEQDAYLLKLKSSNAEITLKPKTELYYKY